ncbi:MAG: acyl-CoA dehydrogenase [Actinobacteria bacterium ATB1]|nr:acyl-CoA dehydrogenase [Actinobacteria bacterium ATB1]
MLEWQERVQRFLDEAVYPAEATYALQHAEQGDRHAPPPVLEELKAEARARGLWNLFFPGDVHGAGLTNLEYAPLAELTGRAPLAAEAMNCSAPDTGNMEILAEFGTPEQKERWLEPLLDGRIRSAFAMTEPEVASSDARNIRCRIERDGDDYVITGRKWLTTGALDPRCDVFVVMGKTDPDADTYHQQSMVLVPSGTRGVTVNRSLTVFGYEDRGGHGDITFDEVRVPQENLLGVEGGGFAIAQARLGPGRIHHCMRAIGLSERALELMCRRVLEREAFGKPLAEQGVVQEWIADSRVAIEQARLLVLRAAWAIDTMGKKAARNEIAAIKVAAAELATTVVDRAIQAHGGGGVTQEFPLAAMYSHARTLHFVDGPDEVHRRAIARTELARHR